jgi:hypothetical protein
MIYSKIKIKVCIPNAIRILRASNGNLPYAYCLVRFSASKEQLIVINVAQKLHDLFVVMMLAYHNLSNCNLNNTVYY